MGLVRVAKAAVMPDSAVLTQGSVMVSIAVAGESALQAARGAVSAVASAAVRASAGRVRRGRVNMTLLWWGARRREGRGRAGGLKGAPDGVPAMRDLRPAGEARAAREA
ncbi:hypothetical protein GCM10025873_20710 [Demequina sediminis]|nr:hypothetical protein GCM10025873_20710 [Demequina sediminis]